ncbi:MAG TPA: hypothetical protein VK281_08530 [Xanthobacteraceae bacterium]|nr:hypothetical protein [Xanthobacteraceae bacterium]
MSSASDRSGEAGGPSSVARIRAVEADCSDRVDIADIRGGVRKAHGFTLTDENILRAVETTIEVADSVLLAAARAADAGQRDGGHVAPAAAGDSVNAYLVAQAVTPPWADMLPGDGPGLRQDAQSGRRSFTQWGVAVSASVLIAGMIAADPLSLVRPPSSGPSAVVPAPPAAAAVEPAPEPPLAAGPVDRGDDQALAPGMAQNPAVIAAAAAPAPPPAEAAELTYRKLDRADISLLRKRGEEFLANGDVAAARLMLRRAAEAADARSALLLATTYDPIALDEMRIRGAFADPAMARTWYERAKAFGSPDAPHRLELLASRDR